MTADGSTRRMFRVPLCAAFAACFLSMPAQAAPQAPVVQTAPSPAATGIQASSDHFALYSDADVDAATLLSDLEAFRRVVLDDLGLSAGPEPRPLVLTITDDLELFGALSPGGITAAVYLRGASGADIVVGASDDADHLLGSALEPGWLRLVLRHETVHHILETHYPRKLPIWLGEGLAEYYATWSPDADGLAVFGRALPEQDPLSQVESWLPMRTVIESMARYPDYAASTSEPLFRAQRLYYGQSWALAHFVMDQPEGLARIHRFVDGLDGSRDSEDSFEAAFGLRYGPLEARMREGLVEGAERLRVTRPQTPERPTTYRVGALDGASAEANRLRLLYAHGRDNSVTDALIATAHVDLDIALRGGPLSPDMQAELGLAKALYRWRQGNWDAADAVLEPRLTTRPDDLRARRIAAKVAYGRVSKDQLNDALWADAEAAAARAIALDPTGEGPNAAQMHLFKVAVTLPEGVELPVRALQSLDWLDARDSHLRLPHEAMMMIPALIYSGQLDRADRVLDNAERWTTDPTDRFVIDRLRSNVAAERAR